MKKKSIEQYNRFRSLCLQNAVSNLNGAERLRGQTENHLVLHLCLLALEETGKVFLGWVNLRNRDAGEPVPGSLDMEDHIRKLFWAIWGPLFTQEVVTTEQIREIQGVATKWHQLRLFSLYTALEDMVPNSQKISNELVDEIHSFVISRVQLAQAEGEVDESNLIEPDPLQQKFFEITGDPSRREKIFSQASQEKLVELGNIRDWTTLLVQEFEAEEARLAGLLQAEFTRQPDREAESFRPKWRITSRLVTPTHTIRPKVSQIEASYVPFIRVRATGDRSVLEVDIDLDQVVPIDLVYQQGLLISDYFAAALSVGSRGLFWQDARVDPGRYYEKIVDLELDAQLAVKSGQFLWEWPQQKLPFKEDDLRYSHFVFRYLLTLPIKSLPEWLRHYLNGLAMLATSNVHLHLGLEALMQFHAAFRKAVVEHEHPTEGHLKDYSYSQLERVVADKATFQAVIDKAEDLLLHRPPTPPIIKLAEVLQLKTYCDWYLMTLAARHSANDPTLKLTILPDNSEPA